MTEGPADSVICPNCGWEVPPGNYCIRCGVDLAEEREEATRRRRVFAAFPDEGRFALRLASTLFPQLPRASLRAFRIALVAGTAVIAGLGAAGFFPVALVAAALLVPTLMVLYLYDVDVYEDEPLVVVSLTMVWGAAMGIAAALVTQALSPGDPSFLVESVRSKVLEHGVGLPLLNLALMLVGPLVLLPYPRFNDVLDGVTFGAAASVSFVSAEVLVQSGSVLRGGLRPVGAEWAWVLRLVELAIATPVLTAATIGAAAGALWLRYRAPVTDRRALGPFGRPEIVLVVAAIVLVVAALVQILLGAVMSFVLLFAIAAASLLWLRAVVHVGLMQEAAEIPIGPDITCANCGARTRRHSFCRNCGISLLALPKGRSERPPEEPGGGPSGAPPRPESPPPSPSGPGAPPPQRGGSPAEPETEREPAQELPRPPAPESAEESESDASENGVS